MPAVLLLLLLLALRNFEPDVLCVFDEQRPAAAVPFTAM